MCTPASALGGEWGLPERPARFNEGHGNGRGGSYKRVRTGRAFEIQNGDAAHRKRAREPAIRAGTRALSHELCGGEMVRDQGLDRIRKAMRET